ncbi:hypothetical protein Sjap_002705 [Stephania japonica]|uniref:Uncharacterized protein n=1 Tax=Stephania japonica TaxID=461633 RepID=A0AAP0KN98_9MAGN
MLLLEEVVLDISEWEQGTGSDGEMILELGTQKIDFRFYGFLHSTRWAIQRAHQEQPMCWVFWAIGA